MRQGTTPEFVFELPFDTEGIKNAKIIFVTYGGYKLEKRLDDCAFEGNKIKVRLSQAETFRFDCTHPLKVQLRILTKGGDALTSETFCVDINECLDNEVLA